MTQFSKQAASLSVLCFLAANASAQVTPNVVYILTDDWGWRDGGERGDVLPVDFVRPSKPNWVGI